MGYITLDDIASLALAKNSPKTFLQALDERVIIDEIQRAPELFLPIKEYVDSHRQAGKYILTGSANILTLPKLSESLAGRMEMHTLWPLSQGELRGKRECFVDTVFQSTKLPQTNTIKLPQLINILTIGGYPAVLERGTQKLKDNWFRGYISSIIERDVRALSEIERLTELPDLLSLIASRSGGTLNLADLSRTLGLPYMTLKRYLSLLETVYLVVPLNPWYNNLGKRLIKSPKLYINDSGLLCHLLHRDSKALETDRSLLGMVFENFVFMELLKQISWSELRPRLYHFRTADTRHEVDFLLEAPDGRIVGIECKSSANIDEQSFKGLRALAEYAGDKFYRGLIIYNGSNTLAFAENLYAVPVSALWEINSGKASRLF